jgi:ERCC4-type nuclease
MGKRDQLSEFEVYLRESARRTKRSMFEIERTGTEAALNRCRELARQLQTELARKRTDHFVDMLSLADFQVSLERAAFVLEQKSRPLASQSRTDEA